MSCNGHEANAGMGMGLQSHGADAVELMLAWGMGADAGHVQGATNAMHCSGHGAHGSMTMALHGHGADACIGMGLQLAWG